MQISLGNTDQITALVQLFTEVIRRLRENGALDELADNIVYTRKLVHASITAHDVAAYELYRGAGMSSEEAVQLLISRRMGMEEISSVLGRFMRVQTQ